MKFKDLENEKPFQFRNGIWGKVCWKISPRKYRDEDGGEYKIGSINVEVYLLSRGESSS